MTSTKRDLTKDAIANLQEQLVKEIRDRKRCSNYGLVKVLEATQKQLETLLSSL